MSLYDDDPAAELHRPFAFTPYVDFLLVLLTVTGVSAAEEARRYYTKAVTRPALPDPEEQRRGSILDLCVGVTRDGRYQVDELGSGPLSLREVEDALRGRRRDHQDVLVLVDGDARCPYGAVVQIEDVCDRLGLAHRRLVNRREGPDGGGP